MGLDDIAAKDLADEVDPQEERVLQHRVRLLELGGGTAGAHGSCTGTTEERQRGERADHVARVVERVESDEGAVRSREQREEPFVCDEIE